MAIPANIQAIGLKIQDSIRGAWVKPLNKLDLTLRFLAWLDESDLDTLHAWGEEVGEKAVGEWLTGQMQQAAPSHYEADGEEIRRLLF